MYNALPADTYIALVTSRFIVTATVSIDFHRIRVGSTRLGSNTLRSLHAFQNLVGASMFQTKTQSGSIGC